MTCHHACNRTWDHRSPSVDRSNEPAAKVGVKLQCKLRFGSLLADSIWQSWRDRPIRGEWQARRVRKVQSVPLSPSQSLTVWSDELSSQHGCLKVVEWGVASAGEIGSAPLAAEMLDVSLDAAFAVAHEGMYLVIGDAEEVAKRIEACETGGADLFLAPSRAFALGVGLHLTLDRARL